MKIYDIFIRDLKELLFWFLYFYRILNLDIFTKHINNLTSDQFFTFIKQKLLHQAYAIYLLQACACVKLSYFDSKSHF
jgi:hypothetical protein